MGSKTVQVKGGCTFGRTRRFTAAGSADRPMTLSKNVCFYIGGCKLSKVHLCGVCDCRRTAKFQAFQGVCRDHPAFVKGHIGSIAAPYVL